MALHIGAPFQGLKKGSVGLGRFGVLGFGVLEGKKNFKSPKPCQHSSLAPNPTPLSLGPEP